MLAVPDRPRLHAALRAANQRGTAWIVLSVLGALLALGATRWDVLVARPLIGLIAVGIAASGTILAAIYVAFRNQRWLEDLAPDRVLGAYRRDDLVRIVEDVHRRLGLGGRTPVAITADKDLNASAMTFGLAWLFPRLNAIYLHRPMLHVLAPDELAAVVGHELGHYHRHRLRFASATLLHVGLLVSVALLVASRVASPSAALFLVALAVGAHRFLVGVHQGRVQRAIEHLCDEAGVEAAGALAHVNVELKLGLEQETTLALQARLLQEGHDLPAARLLELYEEAMPYSRPDPAELARRISARVREERASRKGLSVRGYLDFIGGQSGEDLAAQAESAAALARTLASVELLPWDRERFRARGAFDEAEVEALVALMRAHPDRPLFRVPEDAGLVPPSTHPPPRPRILYIWENRSRIGRPALASAPR